MGKNPVVHFEIPADNPEELAKFYASLFDWKIEKAPGEFDYWMISTVDTDESGMPSQAGGINGGMAGRMSPEQRPMNYVMVDDVDAYVARAASLGAQVAMGKAPIPGMGWLAQLVDPDGNLFGVWAVDPDAA